MVRDLQRQSVGFRPTMFRPAPSGKGLDLGSSAIRLG